MSYSRRPKPAGRGPPPEVIDDYDVFIAGGGALGATFARFLAPTLKVVIAEAGAQLSKAPGEHLKNSYLYQKDIDPFTQVVAGHLHKISIPFDGSYLDTVAPGSFNPVPFLRNGQNSDQRVEDNLTNAPSTYSVGGMLTHWTCSIPRHHPKLERWNEVYSDAEWDEYYSAAEKLLNLHSNLFDNSVRHTVILDRLRQAYKEILPEEFGPKPLPMAGELVEGVTETNDGIPWRRVKWTGADTVFGKLGDPTYPKERFSLLTEHLVKKINWKPIRHGHHDAEVKYEVESVEVKDLLTGRKKIFKAKYFIIATNAILVPQILWNSGIGRDAAHITENQGKVSDPAKLPVGRYITDQPMVFAQVILHKDLVAKAAELAPKHYPHWTPIEGDPTGMPISEPPPNIWIPVSTGKYKYLDFKTGKRDIERTWHGQVHRDAFGYGAVPANVDERVVVDMRWFGAHTPKFSNYIEFRDFDEKGRRSSDRYGLPQATFHYKTPEEDLSAMNAMFTDLEFASSALGGYFPNVEPKWMPPGSSIHFQGGYRAGKENDGKSVVDPNSRVWLFDNLYLAGNGVIPTSTSSNPTPTSVAFAYRAAQAIRRDAKVRPFTWDEVDPYYKRH